MSLDFIPIWAFFVLTIIIVMASIEGGYSLGRIAHERSAEEKESPASAIAGSVLGLLAFMLAFTFGIVTNRFDARKGLVRDEANAIGTAWLRADFLPEPDRSEAKELYREYTDLRVNAVTAGAVDLDHMKTVFSETDRIHRRLWEMAVSNGRKETNSDIMALYVDSLNTVIDIHALRVSIGFQSRIPPMIWLVLYGQMIFGMMAVGYHTGISGSKRSMARPILALSFALVILLIAALDRPQTLPVSHQPLIDLRASMEPVAAPAPSAP